MKKNHVYKSQPVYCIKSLNVNATFRKGTIYTETSYCDDIVDGEWIFIQNNDNNSGYKFSVMKKHRYLLYFSDYFITMQEYRKLKLQKLNELSL